MSVEFVDTNIFFYSLDLTAGSKRHKAKSLIARLFETGAGAISTQVLIELYSTATRKLPLPAEELRATIAELDHWTVHQPSHASILSAIDLKDRHQIPWLDALILNSATELGCSILWTEDLSSGQQCGSVRVLNPFL